MKEPAITTGAFPGSRKIFRQGSRADIRVPMREIEQQPTKGTPNPPVVLYDTSGPYTQSGATLEIERGLPGLRENWISERSDTSVVRTLENRKIRRAQPGRRVTQMHYAR